MKDIRTTEARLSRARTQLLLNQPFFGTLCLRLKLECGNVPTLATDGRRIVYNVAFVDSLRPPELEGALAHEVLHCALAHQCRRGDRDPQLWNEAADLAINPILIANGLTLPAGALNESRFAKLSAEEIYAQLQRERDSSSAAGGATAASPQGRNQSAGTAASAEAPPQSPPPAGADSANQPEAPAPGARPGGFGEVLDATAEGGAPASQAERSRQDHEWAIASEQAVRAAEACGRAPVDLERRLAENRESQQDWRSILRDFLAGTIPSDYQWTPPNRRFIASGLYLPSIRRSGLGEVVIVVDTSGSIGDRELAQFAGEVNAIADETKPETIHVVYCDAAVQSVQQFCQHESIDLRPRGRGGTDFRPPFAWVAENGLAPNCLIYLTDLCCRSFPEPPAYPVLWVTDSRRVAPFGETVKISAD